MREPLRLILPRAILGVRILPTQGVLVLVERYLTTQEVADLYRTTPGTVRYWRHIGKGPKGVRAGRRVLYAESEVLRFDQALRGASA